MPEHSIKDAASSDRFAYAADRTMLANERTLAAWWRTAMGAIAAAVAFARLFGDVGPDWLVRSGATVLVAFGVMILVLSHRRYLETARRIDPENVDRLSRLWLNTGMVLLVIVALVAGAAVWV